MAWSDEPTEAQLAAVFNLTKWVLPRDLGKAATDYLEETATRREVSYELGRLRDLEIKHKLKDRESVFASDIWEGFNYKEFLK